MNKPIPKPESVTFYLGLSLQKTSGKFIIHHNPDTSVHNTGLFPSLEEAQQFQLMEAVKGTFPEIQIFPIEWQVKKEQ